MSEPLVSLRRAICRKGGGGASFELSVEAFDLFPGEYWAVVGPSGSGKSTLLDAVGLARAPAAADQMLYRAATGPIDAFALWRNGRAAQLAALRRELIGYVVQTGALLPFLSVSENIRVAGRISDRAPTRSDVETLAERLGVIHLLDRPVSQASVGERQRVAVARALITQPQLVIADEPTAALDADNGRVVFGLLTQLCRERGAALLCATHDTELATRFGLRRLDCAAGRLQSQEVVAR
ncbi:MAG: ATP-binding cassette domain-containing protein [Nitratireductor sp.]